MYGVDGPDTQAFGNNPGVWDLDPAFTRGGKYGWALPQLYGEVAMGDLSVKIGHFYTLVGYEVVPAPQNFFYSHSIMMYNTEPFTHTGAIATYEMNDCTTLYGGWTAGWDTGFDQFGDGSTFLGGFSRNINEDASFTYITTFGDLGERAVPGLLLAPDVEVNVDLVLLLDLQPVVDLKGVARDHGCQSEEGPSPQTDESRR